MNKDEIKMFLKSYSINERLRTDTREMIRHMESQRAAILHASKSVSLLDGMQHGTGRTDPTAEKAAKLEELDDRLKTLRKEEKYYTRCMEEVEEMLDKIPDARRRGCVRKYVCLGEKQPPTGHMDRVLMASRRTIQTEIANALVDLEKILRA